MAQSPLTPLDGERCEECFGAATRIVIYYSGTEHCARYLCSARQCVINSDAWLGEIWDRIDETDQDSAESDATGEK